MSGDGGHNSALASMQASMHSAAPVNGAIGGGRVALLGGLPDAGGLFPGLTNVAGWGSKQIASPFGSLFSGQQRPGLCSQLGFSRAGIWDQIKECTSNNNMQAVAANMTSGVESTPMAQLGQLSSGAPAGGRGDIEIS